MMAEGGGMVALFNIETGEVIRGTARRPSYLVGAKATLDRLARAALARGELLRSG